MILKEATISSTEANLLDMIRTWVTSWDGLDLPIGTSVYDLMRLGRALRQQIAAHGRVDVDLHDQNESADLLHGVCRSLMDDCADFPREVLDEARAIKGLLEAVRWKDDIYDEHKELLSSLTFCAWRSTRILGLPADAQRWEAEYLHLFRDSLQLKATAAACQSGAPWWVTDNESQPVVTEPETIFQLLLYLQDSKETAPELVAKRTYEVHDFLRLRDTAFPSDLQYFFLGESARILGSVMKYVGRPREVEGWLEQAEAYFHRGPNPAPQLARIKAHRLALLYQLNGWELVCQAAPGIDRMFSTFAMEEDRVKWRIVWAATLKLAGKFDEALDVLKPLLESRARVRPELLGWVLLQAGDIHQICGDHSRAIEELTEAAQLLREGAQFTGLAEVSATISYVFRSHGMLSQAIELLESSRKDHKRLGMKWNEAYKRMLIAETFLAMGRAHDAEIEIRAALPILEEQAMVADALAAASLLREALQKQKLDERFLGDGRDHPSPNTK